MYANRFLVTELHVKFATVPQTHLVVFIHCCQIHPGLPSKRCVLQSSVKNSPATKTKQPERV